MKDTVVLKINTSRNNTVAFLRELADVIEGNQTERCINDTVFETEAGRAEIEWGKESFPVTSVSREDLEARGFDTSGVSDETMERLASKMSDNYCEQLFWISLNVIAEHLGIPKKAQN